MSKVEVLKATEIRGGSIICPGCGKTQGFVNRDFEPGIYQCEGHCGGIYTVDQELIDSRLPSIPELKEFIIGLEKRILKLEKELGIIPK